MPKAFSPVISALGGEVLRFATRVDAISAPDKVLDDLHKATSQICGMHVLVAILLPLQWGDWSGLEKGKTVFLHESAPKGWWEEWLELSRSHPGPGLSLARISLAPFTQSEIMRRFEPLGSDRWPVELALKYGMRDGLTCPIGGRWVIAFWSGRVLSQRLSEEARAILFMGANFATIQLQKLVEPHVARIGKREALTPRELAVLRLLADGNRIADMARHLQLSEETIRSHIKKAQIRLGARTSAQAVGLAVRRQLIA